MHSECFHTDLLSQEVVLNLNSKHTVLFNSPGYKSKGETWQEDRAV